MQNKWVQFEGRLKQLEVDLHRHHETVGKLKHTIKHLISNSPIPNQYQQHSNHTVTVSSTTTIVPESHVSCSSQFRTVPRTDIQVSEIIIKREGHAVLWKCYVVILFFFYDELDLSQKYNLTQNQSFCLMLMEFWIVGFLKIKL